MANQLEPFVGPRPFEREDEKYFFGRDQAANELVSLILSYPTVILYAQSGAGKTSLLKAKVLSVLEDKKGFDVPPIARVRGQGAGAGDAEIANVYVANALRDLSDNSLSPEQRAQLTFAEYLAARPRPPLPPSEFDDEEEDEEGRVRRAMNRPRVLIFDQFEELFTLYPERYGDRKDFFEQLRDALEQDSLLRVVFSMREDYIAELDPYVHILPDSLRTRFRIERLRKEPAVQAVLGPITRFNEQVSQDKRIQISKEVAEALVDNLRTIKVHSGADEIEFEGEFVEPVHLQIVCKALLEKMVAEGKPDITDLELKEFGNVNQALADYFERAIAKASQQGGVDEGKLRRWFNEVLITPENTRSTVLRGKTQTAGISNDAIDVLAAERLIRSETRDNREWYELSHDKLIEPIRFSFQRWLLKQGGDEQMRLSFIARAEKWLASHRADDSLLLTAADIARAKRWTNHEADGYDESLAALVDASQAALDRVERERERAHAKKLRRLAAGLAVMVVVSIMMAVVSTGSAYVAIRRSRETDSARADAELRRKAAEEARRIADDQREIARLEGEDAERERKKATEQQLLAEKQAAAAQQAERKAAAAAVAEKKASAEAKLQKTLAIASSSAARAELSLAQQPSQIDNSVKRALASLALNQDSIEGEQALRHTTALLPLLVKEIDFNPSEVAFTPDGDIAAYGPVTALQPARGPVKLFSASGVEKAKVERTAEGVYSVMSDNGRYVALVGKGEIRVTNLTDGKETIPNISYAKTVGENLPWENELHDATFSPDGKYLAGVISDYLLVWEIGTSQLVMDVLLESLPRNYELRRISSIAISQNGEFISALIVNRNNDFAQDDGVYVYRIKDGEQLFSARSTKLVHSLGENYLAVGADEVNQGTLVRVFDLSKGVVTGPDSAIAKWLTPTLVQQLVFSKSETKLASVNGNQVTVWDPTSGREITRVGHTVDITSVVFSRDGGLLATTDGDRTTRLWDVRTGQELFRLGHEDDVVSVSFSTDGKYLVTGSNEVRLWDISRTGLGLDLYQDDPVDQVILSHNGNYMAVITAKEGTGPTVTRPKNIKIFDTLTGRQTADLNLHRLVLRVAFSHDDQLLFVAGTRKIEARQVTGGNKTDEFSFDGNVNSIEFSANGRYAVALVINHGVELLNLSHGESAQTLPFRASSPLGRVAITHDGSKIFFQNKDGLHYRWDKESGLVTPVERGLRTGSIKTSFDGRYLASQSVPLAWKIYDVKQSRTIFDEEAKLGLRNITFSNDARYVALAFRNDNTIQIYDLPNQTLKAEFTSENPSALISFSEDQNYVASGGGGLVQVWSLTARKEVTRIEYNGSLRAIGYSRDGKYLMTGSTDRTVRFSLLRTSDLIDIACQRTSGGLTKTEWKEYFPAEPYRPTCPGPK